MHAAASLCLLASFVYPLSVDEFMRSCWQQKALHCQWKPESDSDDDDAAASAPAATQRGKHASLQANAIRDRFAYVKRTHLHSLRVRALLENTASDSLFVWCRSKSSEEASVASAAAPLASFELDASNPAHITAAETLHGAGSSLYFRAPPSMLSEYAGGMSRAVGFDFAGVEPASASASPSDPVPQPQPKGEIEVFLSRAGHVTDWHFDFMENFTLQLRGTKRWLIRRSTIAHPLRGATPHYADKSVEEQQQKIHSLSGDAGFSWSSRPSTRADPSAAPASSAEEYETVDLRAGDCFYHPAGIWHRVECSADSVSVNISLVAADWATTVTEGIKQQLWKQDEWRSTVQCKGMQDARAQLSRKLDGLRAAVAQLRAEDYLPPSLFLPRQTHYAIRNEPAYDDESCRELCALACLEEQEASNGATAATETKQRKKQKTAAATSSSSAAVAAPAPAAAAAASPSPISSPPLLLSALSPSTQFRVNPLALLLRFDHRKLAREVLDRSARLRKERREAGDELSDEDEEAEQEADEMSDAGSSVSASGSGSPSSKELPGSVGFVLHFSFGNESLESSVRVTMDVAAELAPCMDRIRALMMEKRESFRGEEAVLAAASVEKQSTTASKQKRGRAAATVDSESAVSASFDRARSLLFFLCQQGALHVV